MREELKKTITCGRLILTSKYLLKGLKSKIAKVSKIIIIGANKVSSDTSKPIAVGEIGIRLAQKSVIINFL